MKNGGVSLNASIFLPEIHSCNSCSARLQRGVAEMFHITVVAELLADEFAQDAVAFAVKDAHFLDAQ